ncbi:MAG TPA: retropepsin-like aspartic protease [Steroidobacteraceae bacterium]|nr:retropepsin-like aspartic protease [Steroidobacteraceae bacterium]
MVRQKYYAYSAGLLLLIGALCPVSAETASTPPAGASAPAAPGTPAAPSTAPEPAIAEVAVTAPEPRYVAPTLRDKLGRIWAPVYLNGKGPYRLVLDTGANSSAITARVAADLGLPLVQSSSMMLHGVTGSAVVPFVKVDTFVVGDMEAHDKVLPIVPDALGGADGVLGMEGLEDKRIFIDFMHDKITIRHSHNRRADDGYVTVPLTRAHNGLLMTTAYIGSLRVEAIIDTGGQATVANPALRAALKRRYLNRDLHPSSIIGATDDVQAGQDVPIPPVSLGPVTIHTSYLTVSDLRIFELWNMTTRPAMLIGIDTLGLLDNLVIDYRRMELQIRTRHNF